MNPESDPQSAPPPLPPVVAPSRGNPSGVTQPMPAPATGFGQFGGRAGLVTCPRCGSNQFVCEKKITGAGWVWIMCGLGNILVSGLLMFIFIGFITIFFTPIATFIGAYSCRRLVNTCAACKHEW